jgi:nucleoid DNA-binding protein
MRPVFARKILAVVWEEIGAELAAGRRVCFHELGAFKPIIHPGRKFYNPRTKKIVSLPPRRDVKFSPAKALLKKLPKLKRKK